MQNEDQIPSHLNVVEDSYQTTSQSVEQMKIETEKTSSNKKKLEIYIEELKKEQDELLKHQIEVLDLDNIKETNDKKDIERLVHTIIIMGKNSDIEKSSLNNKDHLLDSFFKQARNIRMLNIIFKAFILEKDVGLKLLSKFRDPENSYNKIRSNENDEIDKGEKMIFFSEQCFITAEMNLIHMVSIDMAKEIRSMIPKIPSIRDFLNVKMFKNGIYKEFEETLSSLLPFFKLATEIKTVDIDEKKNETITTQTTTTTEKEQDLFHKLLLSVQLNLLSYSLVKGTTRMKQESEWEEEEKTKSDLEIDKVISLIIDMALYHFLEATKKSYILEDEKYWNDIFDFYERIGYKFPENGKGQSLVEKINQLDQWKIGDFKNTTVYATIKTMIKKAVDKAYDAFSLYHIRGEKWLSTECKKITCDFLDNSIIFSNTPALNRLRAELVAQILLNTPHTQQVFRTLFNDGAAVYNYTNEEKELIEKKRKTLSVKDSERLERMNLIWNTKSKLPVDSKWEKLTTDQRLAFMLCLSPKEILTVNTLMSKEKLEFEVYNLSQFC